MKKEIKRGYVKWRDENGVLHKEPVKEAQLELDMEIINEESDFGDDE